MRCHFWTDHHSKADHIGLRDGGHFLWKFQKYIPARDEDFGGVGSLSKDAGVVIGLQIEKDFLKFSQNIYNELKRAGAMTLGLDDMIMANANAHEGYYYLLQQRIKSSLNR